jgi:uncharacterized protein
MRQAKSTLYDENNNSLFQWPQATNNMLDTLKAALIIAAVIYVVLGAYLYLNQQAMIYFPDQTPFEECAAFLEEEKIVHGATRMYVREGNQDYLVVYHGNAGRACQREHITSYTERTVILVEYPGYGGDPQKPSEERLKKAVLDVANYLKEQEPNSIAVLGESIGSSSAAYHASTFKADKVVLIAPFSALADVAKVHYRVFPAKLLLREQHPTREYLKHYDGDVLVLHGTKDAIVPARLSEKLPGRRVLIDGAGHNDLYAHEETIKELESFLRT